MVGFAADELVDRDPPPYWPAEHLPEYRQRQQTRLASAPTTHARDAFETTFVRKSGERFPAMVFEAPLLDSAGRHTGWMSAVLDQSAQRRVEEVARQQQDRLQATARLATAGEMASLLSHELNQPLSAIAAYATGSLNMMDAQGDAADPELWPLLHQASQRIAEQAERAGRVIKSVHDFVRRREHARETIGVDALIEAILPLVRLQARKSDTRIALDAGTPMPKVVCDRAMVEQVLLNLTRNAIEAMQDVAPERRLLRIVAAQEAGQVTVAVIDQGHGIAPEVAERLFSPFFSTKAEGMGMGLSICRTAIEFHGGTLSHSANPAGGTVFKFALPHQP
jgi:two-component system sensor histidine kinase DctS